MYIVFVIANVVVELQEHCLRSLFTCRKDLGERIASSVTNTVEVEVEVVVEVEIEVVVIVALPVA